MKREDNSHSSRGQSREGLWDLESLHTNHHPLFPGTNTAWASPMGQPCPDTSVAFSRLFSQ